MEQLYTNTLPLRFHNIIIFYIIIFLTRHAGCHSSYIWFNKQSFIIMRTKQVDSLRLILKLLYGVILNTFV